MKNIQKSYIIGIVILLILAVGTYLYFKNTTPKSDINISDKLNGKCGLTITSHLPNEKFTWPLVIKGAVASKQANSDCSWQTFENVSGTAQLYYNEDNKGWKSVGDSVIFRPDLSVTFNYTEIALPMNTPMKVVFTEENPAVIRPALVFELPLVLK